MRKQAETTSIVSSFKTHLFLIMLIYFAIAYLEDTHGLLFTASEVVFNQLLDLLYFLLALSFFILIFFSSFTSDALKELFKSKNKK